MNQREKAMALSLCEDFVLDSKNFRDVVTNGQLTIFNALVSGKHKRIEILCSTQYGKSITVGLACLELACILNKKVVIVAPSAPKAKIIMRYVIDHLGDSPEFENQLEAETKLERLRLEGSKEKLSFRGGGCIFVISGNENNSKKKIESAMGEGAEIVIMDEACLISDEVEATIFRMIAGKGVNAVYCKIGNPFYRLPPYSHFWSSWNDPNYYRIFIDDRIAIEEGRYSDEFLLEAKTKPFYEILYKCEFPDEDSIDPEGFRPLITSKYIKYGVNCDIMKAIIKKEKEKGELKHELKLGCDIGAGGDSNVYLLRYGNYACVESSNHSNDTMTNVSEIERIAEEWKDYGFEWSNVNIDDIGVGRGVSDRLKEKGYNINGVSVGMPATEKDKFANIKAELYWKVREWAMNEESRLDTRREWEQLTWIRYKVSSDKQVKIEPKDKLKKASGKSPDFAEALMLSFYDSPYVGFA